MHTTENGTNGNVSGFWNEYIFQDLVEDILSYELILIDTYTMLDERLGMLANCR